MFQHSGLLEHLLEPHEYSDPAVFEAERERLFRPEWQFFAPACELARPGDSVARDVLGIPVVVRNFDGELRAFENVCAHRHCLVAAPGRSRAPRLRCQYHGWEYAADGRVARIPDGPSFRGLRADGLGLPPLRVERLGGMLFVHLGAEGESLRASLGELADEIERYFGRHRCISRWVTEHAVNWKVIAENAVESYHVPQTHPNTFESFRPPELHEHQLEKRWTRYLDLKPWGRRPVEIALRACTRLLLREPSVERFKQTHVFPSTLLWYGDLYSSFIALEPLGPERTRHVQLGFVPREIRAPWLFRPLQATFTLAFAPAVRRVLREDMRLWPDIQHGLRHSRARGVLGAREERVHAFQRHVREAIGDPDPARRTRGSEIV